MGTWGTRLAAALVVSVTVMAPAAVVPVATAAPSGAPGDSVGLSIDGGWEVTVGPDGSAFLTGFTGEDFQTTPGAYDETVAGGTDAFVAKIDPTGRLVFATVLGGSSGDDGMAIAVDAEGATFLAGRTDLTNDFPTTRGAIARSFTGPAWADSVGFLAKISPDGSTLEWSTLLPATRDVRDVAVLSDGRLRVVGEAYPDFEPSVGAFDTEMTQDETSSTEDYVATVSPDGQSWNERSFVGGSNDEFRTRMAVGPDDYTYLIGQTHSSDFVTTPGAFDRTYNGPADVFVMKVAPDLGSIVWSTYLGGGGSALRNETSGMVAVGLDSSVYVTGTSDAVDFPTTPGGPTGTPADGKSEAWLARLDPTGSSVMYAGFLPAYFFDVEVGPDGDVYIPSEAATDETYGAMVGSGPFALHLSPEVELRRIVPLSVDPYALDVDAAGTLFTLGNPLPGQTGRSSAARTSPAARVPLSVVSRDFRCTIRGTSGDDVLVGTSGPDVICAAAGDDVVDARGGYDVIRLGDGKDRVDAGRGVDIIIGGAGGDVASGGPLRDLLLGGQGNDRLDGDGGFDELRGGDGRDGCRGGSGRTTLRGCENR